MTLRLNRTQVKVLLTGLEAVGWGALPQKHPERLAAEGLILTLKGGPPDWDPVKGEK